MTFAKIITFVVITCHVFANGVIVTTTDGQIMGRDREYGGVDFYSFQGIRYAQPPTGNLRFKPPVPIEPWTDILDATQQGAVCPQSQGTYNFSQTSEDCLFLNVFTPANLTAGAPVLFWVHGGEFNALSGNEDVFGPQFLIPHGIIFVTANYRLGALGYLSLDLQEASGNAGLKDVTLALKWVKNNIGSFGGDPDSITIGGQSAGSVVAHYLMLTTTTSGLFHRAILHSGSALGFRFLARDPVSNAFALGKYLGIDTEDRTILLEQLIETDPFDIINATNAMGESDDRKGFRPFAPFVPNVEIVSPHAFITEEPLAIIKGGLPQNYPVLAGFNEDEGIKMYKTFIENPKYIDQLNENFERCIPTDIEYSAGSVEAIMLAERIKKFYFNGENMTDENINKYIKLITDTQFLHSIDYWIRLHKSQSSSQNVYYYKFKYDGQLNWFKIRNNIDYPGTSHADDLGYFFYTANTEPYIATINSTARQMLNNMVLTTVNFVKFGSPTSEAGSDLGILWEPCNYPQTNYLQLEPDLRNSEEPPKRTRTLFWEEVYKDYYEWSAKNNRRITVSQA